MKSQLLRAKSKITMVLNISLRSTSTKYLYIYTKSSSTLFISGIMKICMFSSSLRYKISTNRFLKLFAKFDINDRFIKKSIMASNKIVNNKSFLFNNLKVILQLIIINRLIVSNYTLMTTNKESRRLIITIWNCQSLRKIFKNSISHKLIVLLNIIWSIKLINLTLKIEACNVNLISNTFI